MSRSELLLDVNMQKGNRGFDEGMKTEMMSCGGWGVPDEEPMVVVG